MTKSLAWIVFTIALLTATVLSTVGCGGETGKSKTGSVSISMVDSSDPEISSLEVIVDRIDFYNTQSGWHPTITIPIHYDFVKMGLEERHLFGAYAPSGTYSELRINISEAWATDAEGRHQVSIEGISGLLGFRLRPDTVLSDDGAINLIVDFNVEKSIVKDAQGNYSLHPVISCHGDEYAGVATIVGLVTDGTVPLSKASVVVTPRLPSNDSYTAQSVAGDVEGDGIDDTGKFKVWTVKNGVYDITISWTDPNDSSRILSATVPNVENEYSHYINLGTVVLTPGGS